MAKKPQKDATDNWVEAQLGDFKNVPGAKKRTDVKLTIPYTRANVAALAVMIDYVCKIEEPNRGTLRAELPEMHAEIVSVKMTQGAKKQNGIRTKEIQVSLELEFGQAINDGLFQIAEANPATLILSQTQQELQLTPQEGEDGGDGEGD